jgi:hypothetical protein
MELEIVSSHHAVDVEEEDSPLQQSQGSTAEEWVVDRDVETSMSATIPMVEGGNLGVASAPPPLSGCWVPCKLMEANMKELKGEGLIAAKDVSRWRVEHMADTSDPCSDEILGFPRMLGSIDCMNWQWKLSFWLARPVQRAFGGVHGHIGGCCITRSMDLALLLWHGRIKQ